MLNLLLSFIHEASMFVLIVEAIWQEYGWDSAWVCSSFHLKVVHDMYYCFGLLDTNVT